MMDAICGATETKPDCAYIGQRYAGAEKYLGGARGPGGTRYMRCQDMLYESWRSIPEERRGLWGPSCPASSSGCGAFSAGTVRVMLFLVTPSRCCGSDHLCQ